MIIQYLLHALPYDALVTSPFFYFAVVAAAVGVP